MSNAMEELLSEEFVNELKNHDFSIRIKNEKIKAKITDYENIYQLAEIMTCGPPEDIYQEEIFYYATTGRLKMRFNADGSATLIRYHREDLPSPNERLIKHLINSESLDLNSEEARKLHINLLANLGTCGGIVKERKKFRLDQIIIYLDTVEDLGQFVKLEVERRPGQQPEDLQAIIREYRIELGINDEDLTTTPYLEMKYEMI